MKFRNLVAAAAALTMSASTAFAAEVSRAAAPIADGSQFGGDSTILLILAVLLIGAGIFVLADNQDDTPTSP
jgi:predicted transporter